MRLTAALAPLALIAVLACSPAWAASGTIALTGHGEVMAKPDTAYITSGVTSQADTAKAALAANTADMNRLIDVLKAAGIDPDDIQTSGFSVNPNYVYSDQKDANGYQLPPKIAGYAVSNSVTVHVRDLGVLGTVLDQAVSVGANTINGISFSVEDPSQLYNEARKSAFADAKAKAQLYASAAGVTLADIKTIDERNDQSPTPPQPMFAKAMSADRSAPVPVEAGQLTYAIDVNVTWNLKQAGE